VANDGIHLGIGVDQFTSTGGAAHHDDGGNTTSAMAMRTELFLAAYDGMFHQSADVAMHMPFQNSSMPAGLGIRGGCMTSSRLIGMTATALAVALSACGLGATSPSVPHDVRAFVASESILSPQRVEILHEDPAVGIVLFAVRNGPPQDCPSGCFFDRALGLRAENRVGWWDAPYGAGPWSIFDVRATDASVFDPAALSRIKARFAGLDSWMFWSLANFLACDPDTPSATREHLAAEVGQPAFPQFAAAP